LTAILQRKSFQAGIWMAGPICMKVFPAFLLLYPLWRRDARCAAGCALGLFLGLIALPGAVFGPERTVSYYEEFADLIILPGIGQGKNQERAETLHAITKTDTQSFMAMMHNAIYRDINARPANPTSTVRAIHWGIGLVLTGVLCWAVGWRDQERPLGNMMFLGLLSMLMMFLSPVCHLHYYGWLLPVIMGALMLQWENRRTIAVGIGWMALIALNITVHILAHLTENPEIRFFRELGFTTYVGLLIGAVGVVHLYRLMRKQESAPAEIRLPMAA
ncbi:MAG TPA: glycosyltransferase family 87 protein, partial [Gemmataceae bacterium]|nr:glycosyltransferase family 87 protein [Gemmataceae bacterium]